MNRETMLSKLTREAKEMALVQHRAAEITATPEELVVHNQVVEEMRDGPTDGLSYDRMAAVRDETCRRLGWAPTSLMTTREIASLLNVTTSTVGNWHGKGAPLWARAGIGMLFRTAEVASWLEGRGSKRDRARAATLQRASTGGTIG